MAGMADSAYAGAGVDTSRAERAVAGLVDVLRTIDPGRPSRAVLGSGHYANVLRFMAPLTIEDGLLQRGMEIYEKAVRTGKADSERP